MKIWMMNHYATTMFRDRAGRHYWFAKELKKYGHDITVFCATTFLDTEDVIDTHGRKCIVMSAGNIPFVFVRTTPTRWNGTDRIKNMLTFYGNLFPAAKLYAQKYGAPDIILASSVHPLTMTAGIQISKNLHVPCICEIRDLWPEAIFNFGKAKEKSLLGKMLVAGEHWIYRKADSLIFTKEGDIDYLKEKRWTTEQGGDIDLTKCYYINNGVDIKAFEYKKNTVILDDKDLNDPLKFNVTYAGTIRPVNNVGNLLDAAKIISCHRGYEDVQFIIYGEGVELPKLWQRIKDEDILNVKLKGYIYRKYIPYILSHSSVNILNYSQNQYNWSRGNSSNKLFEYMASGKPIISTVHMGYSIIKRYNCGVELDRDSPEALAEQIMYFHDMNKEERDKIGQNAKEGARDFDFNILSKKLMKVIESVV